MASQKQYAVFASEEASLQTSISSVSHEVLDEESLMREIAYCKARLADIQKAPPESLHRRGLGEISHRLEHYQLQLTRLRSQ